LSCSSLKNIDRMSPMILFWTVLVLYCSRAAAGQQV
jgi:hypothetical protein